MAKIRPLEVAVNTSLQQFIVFADNLSIDEQVMPYLGRHSCKMYSAGQKSLQTLKLSVNLTFYVQSLKIQMKYI